MPLTIGPFTIDSDGDSWSLGRLFTPEMDTLADVSLPKVDVRRSVALESTDVTFKGNALATHQIELVWPTDARGIGELSAFGIALDAREVGVRVRLTGTASAKAAAKPPAGPLKIGLGVAAGGDFAYERFNVYSAKTPIVDVIADTIAALRLPSSATTPSTLPAPREVLTTRFNGYLQLSADVSWGAKLTNTRGVNVGDLALAFESRLALAATAAASYRVAGHFDVHCCRAGDRVRFIVRKARESAFTFAADFKLDAAFKTAGLPKTANEFLGKLLGADAERVFRAIDRADALDSLDKVRDAVGEWAGDALSELAVPLIGKALDTHTTTEFLTALREVASQYTSLDERIAGLFQQSVGDIPQLTRALGILAAARNAEALKLVSDSQAWTTFRTLAGDRLYDALLDQSEYAAVLRSVEEARDFLASGPERLKSAIATVQKRCALDPYIRELEKLSSPAGLKALADSQLRRLVALLLDRPFKDVEQAAGPAFKQLRAALAALKQFNDLWYTKVLATANSKFTATVGAEFSRASSSESLLDVEIDVGSAEGRRLARRAALGDFDEILASARSPIVTLREGVLTHKVTRQLALRVNVLGFEIRNVSKLIVATKDTYQETDAGLLLVHTVQAANEQERQRRDERTFTRFMLRGVAEAIVPDGDRTRAHMIDTLRSLSARYAFNIDDSNTSAEELLEYLGFAESLGLLNDRAAFVSALRSELPGGWTRVKVEYIVQYEPNAVAAIFQHAPAELQAAARRSLSSLVGHVLVVAGRPNDSKLGLAYQDEAVRLAFANAKPGVPPGSISVRLPAWVTRDRARTEILSQEQKKLLGGVFQVEDDYLKALGRLDDVLDRLRSNPLMARNCLASDELDHIATRFVDLADNFPTDKRVNPFFGTFDALVLATTPRSRRAAMVLEITPSGGTEPVTKSLSA